MTALNLSNDVRLMVESYPAGLRNELPNPTAVDGAWSWTVGVPEDPIDTPPVGTAGRILTTTGAFVLSGDAGSFPKMVSPRFSITPGQWVAFSGLFTARTGAATVGLICGVDFYDSTGALITSGTTATVTTTHATNRWQAAASQAPANTSYARATVFLNDSAFMPLTAGATVTVGSMTVAIAATSGALTALPFIDRPNGFTNILSGIHSIIVQRDAGLPGTLQADIRDAALNPATNALITRGRQIRLEAWNGSAWVRIYTGNIDSVSTSQILVDGQPEEVTTLVALDQMDKAARFNRGAMVTRTGQIQGMFNDFPVPWMVKANDGASTTQSLPAPADYSAYPLPAGGVAPLLDLIRLVAMSGTDVATGASSTAARVWVDRNGRLRIMHEDGTADYYSEGTSAHTFTDTELLVQSDDRGLSPDDVVNVVNVTEHFRNTSANTWTDYNLTYRAPQSINLYGERPYNIEVITSGSSVDTTHAKARDRAQDILTAMANPQDTYGPVLWRAGGVRISDTSHVSTGKAALDLWSRVTDDATGDVYRLRGITHTIEALPNGDSYWLMGFRLGVVGHSGAVLT